LKWTPLRVKIIFNEKCSSLLFSEMNDDNKLECFEHVISDVCFNGVCLEMGPTES
jgi:hypothetical protein